jgi:predicted DsbA family dithiol-disulfide isomerase
MMKIEIWSDINCPFCYIGKRHLEKALSTFSGAVDIEWRSFELDPVSHPPKGSDQMELLAKKYGKDRAWAVQMNENMTAMAKKSGLEFHMEKIVPANSFKAHRLIHLAKDLQLQDAMKERLLRAKFVEGKDIGDDEDLIACGEDVGLPREAIQKVLESDQYSAQVREDEKMAQALGIQGVPFFVFNKREALSGAQPVEVFIEVLKQQKT